MPDTTHTYSVVFGNLHPESCRVIIMGGGADMTLLRKAIPLILIGTTIASGCYVGVNRHGIAVSAVPLIEVAPPAPQVEVYGTAPYPDAIWIEGYWEWNGGAYTWRTGHWEKARHGYRWVPHAWHREGNAWRFHGGHWERQ